MEHKRLALWKKFKENGSEKVREELILEYMYLVEMIVSRMISWLPASVEKCDLISYGVLGLISAVDRYDLGSGVKFETFAYWRIRGQILDFLRSQDILSRYQREKIKRLHKAMDTLEIAEDSTKLVEELSTKMGCSVEEVYDAMKMDYLGHIISLYEKVDEDRDLIDVISAGENVYEFIEDKMLISWIEELINQLDSRQQKILELYFVEELTLKEIGEILGISEGRVSQILTSTLLWLRKRVEKEQRL